MFEDTKGPIKTTYDINGFFLPHYIENYRSNNTNPNTKPRMNSHAWDVLVVAVPHVTPVVLLLDYTNII
jgi:hypothetical protein